MAMVSLWLFTRISLVVAHSVRQCGCKYGERPHSECSLSGNLAELTFFISPYYVCCHIYSKQSN